MRTFGRVASAVGAGVAAAVAGGCGHHHHHALGGGAEPVFALTSPVGGETLVVGYPVVVTWDVGTYDGPVAIDASKDGGVTWKSLVVLTPNDGSYALTVPASLTGTHTRFQVSQTDLDVTVATSPSSASASDVTVLGLVEASLASGITGAGVPAFGDYDDDGLDDLALSDRVFHDVGGDYDFVVALGATGEPAWADFDGDGRLDLSVGPSLFRGDGQGGFTPVAAPFPADATVLAWGDYDHDGDPDVGARGRIFRNDGSGTFEELVLPDVSRVDGYEDAWTDFDGDGDLDLAFCGGFTPETQDSYCSDPSFVALAFWRNGGNDQFAYVQSMEISGPMAWADLEGDGDDDVLVMGYGSYIPACTEATFDDCGHEIVPEPPQPTPIYWPLLTSDGSGNLYTAPTGVDVRPVGMSAWADADGDGDPDLAVTGVRFDSDAYVQGTSIYRNDGGTLVRIDVPLPGLTDPRLAWGDVDGNGRPDLLLSGKDGPTPVTLVFLNPL
jgi:hypothetical protein